MKYVISAAMFAVFAAPAAADDGRTRKSDPAKGFCFQVEIQGTTAAAFKEVEGLNSELDVVEYQDGDDIVLRKRPGRPKLGSVKFSRSFTLNEELLTWWNNLREGKLDRKPIDVTLRDDCTPPVLYTDFPSKWSISGSVDGKSSDVHAEEITMTVEEIKYTAKRD